MSLTKDAILEIKKLVSEADAKEIKINGKTYTNVPVYFVKEPLVKETIKVRTLSGINDYIKRNFDGLELKRLAIHIASPTKVMIISKICGDWREREFYIEANFKNAGHRFNTPLEKEEFIVSLMSNFEKTVQRDELVECISSIRKKDAEITDDNGISQTVKTDLGVALVSEKKINNPITLKPIRTFTEVNGQPESDYVFRMELCQRSGVLLTLHDSNGDDWEIKAINKIKNYFKSTLSEQTQEQITILG